MCKQYPKEGKCSIETILGLTEMVEQLLRYNQQANKVLPNKIVFYRDGKFIWGSSLFVLNVFTQELTMVNSEKLLAMKSQLFVKLSMVSHQQIISI